MGRMAEKAFFLGHLSAVGLVALLALGYIAVSGMMTGSAIQLRMKCYVGFYLLIHFWMTDMTSLGQITAGWNTQR
jgi:hypothetical protein